MCFRILYFPLLYQKHEDFISAFQHENLMGFLEVKLMNIRGSPLRLQAPAVSHSHSGAHSTSKGLSKLPLKGFQQLEAPGASVSGRRILVVILCIFLSLQIWWGRGSLR